MEGKRAKTKGKVSKRTARVATQVLRPVNLRAMTRVVQAELANLRHDNAKTKRRGEVRGGGKKPWKQKGTGRARVGSIRSPLWRGGGNVFGPNGTQNHHEKINSKERAVVLASVIALRRSDQSLTDVMLPPLAKTKEAAAWLAKEGIEKRPLLVIGEEVAVRPFRNLARVSVATASEVSTHNILSAKVIIWSKEKA